MPIRAAVRIVFRVKEGTPDFELSGRNVLISLTGRELYKRETRVSAVGQGYSYTEQEYTFIHSPVDNLYSRPGRHTQRMHTGDHQSLEKSCTTERHGILSTGVVPLSVELRKWTNIGVDIQGSIMQNEGGGNLAGGGKEGLGVYRMHFRGKAPTVTSENTCPNAKMISFLLTKIQILSLVE